MVIEIKSLNKNPATAKLRYFNFIEPDIDSTAIEDCQGKALQALGFRV